MTDHRHHTVPAPRHVYDLEDAEGEAIRAGLIDAADETAYRRLRTYSKSSTERQVPGPVPADCRGVLGIQAGRGTDREGL